jgi:hypothetical protein
VVSGWGERVGAIRLSNVLDYVLSPSRVLANLCSLPLGDEAKLVTSSRYLPERIHDPEGAAAVARLGTFDAPAVSSLRDVQAERWGERLDRAIWQSSEHRGELWRLALQGLGFTAQEILGTPHGAGPEAELQPPVSQEELLERLGRMAAKALEGERGVDLVKRVIELEHHIVVTDELLTQTPLSRPERLDDIPGLAADWVRRHLTPGRRLELLQQAMPSVPAYLIPETELLEATSASTCEGLRWKGRILAARFLEHVGALPSTERAQLLRRVLVEERKRPVRIERSVSPVDPEVMVERWAELTPVSALQDALSFARTYSAPDGRVNSGQPKV